MPLFLRKGIMMKLRHRTHGTRMMTALVIALVFSLMAFAITVFAEGDAAAAENAPFAYATALSLLPPSSPSFWH